MASDLCAGHNPHIRVLAAVPTKRDVRPGDGDGDDGGQFGLGIPTASDERVSTISC